MRLKRKRPTSSVEPDRFDAAAEVLERWATRGSPQSTLYAYKREAARRQRAPVGAQRFPPTEPRESRSAETPVSRPRVGGDGASEVGGQPVQRIPPGIPLGKESAPAPAVPPAPAPATNESEAPLGDPFGPDSGNFDESEEARLRRRYGSVTADQWRWT